MTQKPGDYIWIEVTAASVRRGWTVRIGDLELRISDVGDCLMKRHPRRGLHGYDADGNKRCVTVLNESHVWALRPDPYAGDSD